MEVTYSYIIEIPIKTKKKGYNLPGQFINARKVWEICKKDGSYCDSSLEFTDISNPEILVAKLYLDFEGLVSDDATFIQIYNERLQDSLTDEEIKSTLLIEEEFDNSREIKTTLTGIILNI